MRSIPPSPFLSSSLSLSGSGDPGLGWMYIILFLLFSREKWKSENFPWDNFCENIEGILGWGETYF